MRARLSLLTCAHLFLLLCASIRNDRIRQPSPFNSMRKPTDTMKNTSLFVSFWAMPERKPSADPPEGKPLSASDLRGVIGGAEWRPLIACCQQLLSIRSSRNSSSLPKKISSIERMRPAKQQH